MSEAYDETSYISRRNKALKEVHRIYADWSDWEKLELVDTLTGSILFSATR